MGSSLTSDECTGPRIFSTLLTNRKYPQLKEGTQVSDNSIVISSPHMLVPTGQCLNAKTGHGERNGTKTGFQKSKGNSHF